MPADALSFTLLRTMVNRDRCITEVSIRCIEPNDSRFPVDPQLEQTWAELAARSLGQLSLNEVRDHVTKALLTAALERVHHNYSKAAEVLGVTRQSVQYLVVRHELRLRSERPGAPHGGQGARST